MEGPVARTTAWFALIALVVTAVTSGCDDREPPLAPISTDASTGAFAGSAACGQCHPDQFQAWSESSHAWAMRESTPEAVSGRFDGSEIAWGEDATARHQREGDYLFVELTEPDLPNARYPADYFLGRDQIEQHLVTLPRGRIQALPVGFDTQANEWFDIFEGDAREPADWGHWANVGMTANSECLYCHTTGYDRGYELESDAYDTTWQEISVGCEACHGPGSAHVRAVQSGRGDEVGYAAADHTVIMDTCASCHALRRKIWDEFSPGERFLDHFDPVLINEPDYGVDGSLLGEAYEWGSFIQSRMYREGVTCFDCHQTHSGELREAGNAMCLTCHETEYDTAAHTHHPGEKAGGSCIGCHMPERTFMSRDQRRDHSFSIPDPGLSLELGLRDACTDCHTDQSALWAKQQLESWYSVTPAVTERRRYTQAVAHARLGKPEAIEPLLDCLGKCEDHSRRAAAAKLLAGYAGRSREVVAGLIEHAEDEDPLVRASVMFALAEDGGRHVAARAALQRGVEDELRLVRINAAWGLRFIQLEDAREEIAEPIANALDEWQRSVMVEAEDPETHHALGLFHTARGNAQLAEKAYRHAIELAPGGIPAHYNLAMLLADEDRPAEAIAELDSLLEQEPNFASALFEVGRLRRVQGDTRLAIAAFTECLRSQRDFPGALFELAHAYVEFEQKDLATYVLDAALEHPYSRKEALAALISIHIELDDRAEAKRWAQIASDEFEDLAADPTVEQLLDPPAP